MYVYMYIFMSDNENRAKIKYKNKSAEILTPRNNHHEHWVNVIPNILLSIHADINTDRRIKNRFIKIGSFQRYYFNMKP